MAANKRMFSNDIVGSDAFLEMPTSTQALYFHLNMKADDEGFVNPKMIMRMVGCGDDDLKILIGKKFVIPFENGVVIVKHWLINNNKIQKDRFKETLYTDQKKSLYLKDNRSYTTNENKGKKVLLTNCSLSVNSSLTQSRVDKSRVEENRIDSALAKARIKPISKKEKLLNSGYDELFEIFWMEYPEKKAKGKAYESWILLSADLKSISINAIKNQNKNNHFWKNWANGGNGEHTPPHATTWLNQKRWEDEVKMIENVGSIKIKKSGISDLTNNL